MTQRKTLPIKISASSARQRFTACVPEYITTNCHGRCCKSHDGHAKVTILPHEVKFFKKEGHKVDGGFLVTDGECPYLDAQGLCKLHGTGNKPFGCTVSPFAINANNTLVVRNRYRMLRCYKCEGPKLPAYINFKPSLIAIFGDANYKRIAAALGSGSGDIVLDVPVGIVDMLKAGQETRGSTTTRTRKQKRKRNAKSREH